MSIAASQCEDIIGDKKDRRSAEAMEPDILTDIYSEEVNIAVWQRQLSLELSQSLEHFLGRHKKFQSSITVSPSSALASVSDVLGDADLHGALAADISKLVDMFCCLFELKHVGIRLTVLDRAMCPKFHVDRVPCRLVSTYQGTATEWLSHSDVDRSKLGRGSQGLSDEQSGLYQHKDDIHRLNSGDVALLKGESWQGNEHAGLVHRSPAVLPGETRLLLTLDFIS